MDELFSQPYYAAVKAPKRLPESLSESRLRQVLTDQARGVVTDTAKRWNAPLREAVRAATALKFADDAGRVVATAPVAVVDGMPQPLAVTTNHIEPWQWWLVLHRSALKQADEGLNLVIEQRKMLAHHLGDISTRIDSVRTTRIFIAELLQSSVEEDLLERFKKIEEDILGAYWFHVCKIQLYWMPLAIFASLFGVSLTTLTVAVLCHELIHAYTHQGIDLNKSSWRTDRFIATDVYVKEGLAQYYTEQIMRGLGDRLPDGLVTFLAKTERQSPPYTTYQNWLGPNSQPSPEATRLAMLEFRNANPRVFDHERFVEILKSAQAQVLGGRVDGDS
jgi:hypothetical protein